jgi:hypothetical protein
LKPGGCIYSVGTPEPCPIPSPRESGERVRERGEKA